MSGLIGHAERAAIARRLDQTFGAETDRAVARRLGCSNTNVSRWRRNQALIEAPSLLAVRREFGVSIDWLLTGEGVPFPVAEHTPTEDTE